MWQRIIAVGDIDFADFGTMDVKRTRHVAAVAKGLQTFAGGPLVDDDVDVVVISRIKRATVRLESVFVH